MMFIYVTLDAILAVYEAARPSFWATLLAAGLVAACVGVA